MKPQISVLLVEDDMDDQEFFIEALSCIPNATLFFVANNGREALERLANSICLPDLIFTDINMPVMGGIECLAEIKKNPQIRSIPVVMLSSSITKIEHARQLGASAFIGKTFDGKGLRSQIEEMVNLDFNMDRYITNQTFPSVNEV